MKKLAVLIFISCNTLVLPNDRVFANLCAGNPRGQELKIIGYENRPTYFEYYSQTAPLIVMLHGMNGCIEDLQNQSQLYPVGLNILWVSGQVSSGEQRVWIVSRKQVGYAQTFDYLRQSVDTAKASGITPSTVLAAGLSMGATSSIAAVCRLPEVFDGAVSVAGADNYPCGTVNRSLLVVGGKADYAQGSLTAKVVSERWVQDSVTCSRNPSVYNQGIVHTVTWTSCENDVIVRQVLLDGVGHIWPKDDYNANKDIALFSTIYMTIVPIINNYVLNI
jgi:poly(3-hydroxybutyrate) depolymerase